MDRLLRLSDIKNVVGLERSSIYALSAKGLFPKQVRVGLKATRWLESEVKAWVAFRAMGKSENEIAELVSALIRKRSEPQP